MTSKVHSLITVAVLALLVLLGGGALWYGVDLMGTYKEEQKKVRIEIAQENLRRDRLAALKSAYERAKEDQFKLEAFFYHNTEEDWLKFITNLEALARQASVKAETSAQDFTGLEKKFAASMDINGSWQNTYRLMKLLEAFPSRLSIINFSAQGPGSPKDAKDSAVWRTSVTLELVSLKTTK